MKPKRVVIIDTKNMEIREGEVTDLKSMQAIVGGYIERAHITEDGHEVYVNEEGLFDNSLMPFVFEGAHQPFVGNAYIIGSVTDTGNNRPATMGVDEAKRMVRFLKMKVEL